MTRKPSTAPARLDPLPECQECGRILVNLCVITQRITILRACPDCEPNS